jgi:serine/threonine-protein kinase
MSLPVSGDVVAGKYRIERVLGTGGMGAVFEATHRVTGKRFAVKWLLPDLSSRSDAVKRFIREAQVAGRFEHPNVVEVYDVGQERGSFYMVMELLEGESLAARLAHVRRLAAADACRIVLPCLRGVARAHAAGIVHRDLKPANIFLCRATDSSGEQPKVLDFGISKMSNAAGEVDSSITKTGMVMGTPHYMSPEQIRGKNVDHRTDVYAFGVILYELLAGKLPFPGETYSELVLQIATETPKPLSELAPDVPRDLVAVVERAMARDPAARFFNVEELAHALEPFAAGARFDSSERSRRPTPLTPGSGPRDTVPLDTPATPLAMQSQLPNTYAPPKSRMLPWLLLGACAALIALGVMVWRMMGQQTTGAIAEQAKAPPAAAAPAEADKEPPAHAEPSAQAGSDEPHPKTIQVDPAEPEHPRVWQPPPGQEGATRPEPGEPIADEPTANTPPRPAHESARDTRKREELEAARRKAAELKKRAQSQAAPNPPSPSGGGTQKSGRLGIEMTEDQF